MKVGVLGAFFCLLVLFFIEGSYGGTTLLDLYPRLLNRQARQAPVAVVMEQQQTSASVTGSVTSVAEGNGEPNSASVYSWQGGQTQAGASQSASADKNNNNNVGTQSQGFSNCLQGYTGNAGGSNSNTANSIGYALCNATYAQSGSQNQNAKARPSMLQGGRPQFPQFGMLSSSSTPIVMNYTFGQVGEGVSGQTHNSQSTVGGPTGNLMNLFAGGIAHTPQGTMAVHHTAFDPQGKPITATQDFIEDVGINSEEHTILGTGHQQGEVEHSSGGMAHINGLQANTTSFFNSHAAEMDTKLENN